MASRLSGLIVAGAAGIACSTCDAQWWWPPTGGMFVSPSCPSPTGAVTLAFSGNWPDACIPNAAQVNWNGGWLDLQFSTQPDPAGCLSVISTWAMVVDVGPLPAGSYPVYVTYFRHGAPLSGRVQAGTIQVSDSCPGVCYANCDGSTSTPALSFQDFSCFLQKFAAGDLYANCDSSTTAPVLNVSDFTCFLMRFSAGCP
jgi:hypothetical protein